MYFVYILECADKTFYIGCTNNLDKRIKAHNESKAGAKYTRTRRPVTLKYSQSFATKSEALKKEYTLKQLSRAEKQLLLLAA